MFCPEALIRTVCEGLRARAAALDAEQAVHGLDSLPELALHPIVREAFAASGLGVLAEWPYPSFLVPGGEIEGAGPSAARTSHSGRRLPTHPRDRQRCDMVLLPDAAARLTDPITDEIAAREAEETMPLFAAATPPAPAGRPPLSPAEAFWLEIKTIGQYTYSAGIPGPNHTYTSELLAAGADLAKLAADAGIRRGFHAGAGGGLLIILFTADRATAEHDLGIFIERMRSRGIPMGPTVTDSFRITDRIGNASCLTALTAIDV